MKQIKTFLIFASVFVSQTLFAQDFGVILGVRTDSATVESSASGTTNGAQTGFYGGGIVNYPISNPVFLRTGFVFTSRNYKFENSGVSSDYSLNYIDIPVSLLFKLADQGGPFIGTNLGLNVSSSCKSSSSASCEVKDVDTVILPVVLGVQFRFTPQIGMEAFYELGTSGYYKDVKSEKAAGAALLITFD